MLLMYSIAHYKALTTWCLLSLRRIVMSSVNFGSEIIALVSSILHWYHMLLSPAPANLSLFNIFETFPYDWSTLHVELYPSQFYPDSVKNKINMAGFVPCWGSLLYMELYCRGAFFRANNWLSQKCFIQVLLIFLRSFSQPLQWKGRSLGFTLPEHEYKSRMGKAGTYLQELLCLLHENSITLLGICFLSFPVLNSLFWEDILIVQKVQNLRNKPEAVAPV